MFIASLPVVAAALFCVLALLCFRGPQLRPCAVLWRVEAGALACLAIALLAACVLVVGGPVTSPLVGVGGLGFSVRLDAVSVVMMGLVAFIGWVVLRYSATYMDGEARQGPFTGWLCLTLAAVMLLVTAGNIVQLAVAWIATSLTLRRLLLHYPDRAAAQRAARKTGVTARLADAALLVAMGLVFAGFGTGDLATILEAARTGPDIWLANWAAATLAIAAVLKSAQFPLHGWLPDVMETPTPVSALLHAGVINAGGFVLIRFADVMLLSPAVLAVLVMIGGFTALFGGLVTRPEWALAGCRAFIAAPAHGRQTPCRAGVPA